MATRNILQLPVRIGLTGSEWVEGAVSGPNASIRFKTAQIALLASLIVPTGPTDVATDSPPAGSYDNYTVGGEFGPTVGFVDLTPLGNINVTGLAAGFDGQITIVTNLAPGGITVTLNTLNGGSVLANQFRMVGDLILTQYNSQAFKYSETIGKWVSM